MNRRIAAPATFTIALGLAGCTGEVVGSESIGGGQQWLCGIEDAAVVCTAAMASAEGESGAYACMPGDLRAACPPADALEGLEGLDALLRESGVAIDVASIPWACLLTGEHERHCARDVGRAVEAIRSEPADGSGDEFTPAPDDGGFAEPTPPSDCLPASWETYFCAHATASYRAAGVDITFPCDVFDYTESFTDLAVASGSVPSGGPSCHDGEWAMREGAWRDAVLRGCMDLDSEILVWCQQGANYAPTTGVCTATGTW